MLLTYFLCCLIVPCLLSSFALCFYLKVFLEPRVFSITTSLLPTIRVPPSSIPLIVMTRDGNGYWTRPESVDPYTFSRVWVAKNRPVGSGHIWIRLYFTGPNLKKCPNPEPWIRRTRFLLKNILRVCCEDRGWADAGTEAVEAAGTTTVRGGLGYGETDALELLVYEAAKRIDKHLMDVIYNRYSYQANDLVC